MPLSKSTPLAIVLLALIAAKAQEFYKSENLLEDEEYASVDSHDISSKVDTAILTVKSNNMSGSVSIYFLSDYCHNCSYYLIASISGKHGHYSTAFLVDSRWNSNLKIIGNNCSFKVHQHFEERANYSLNVYADEHGGCKYDAKFKRESEPYKTNLPIVVAAAVLVSLAIVYSVVDCYLQKRSNERYGSVERFINTDLGSVDDVRSDQTPTPPARPARERMVSVDSFRGLCIVIMIFVNYKGGKYWFFHHASWDGLTVADLVFPWFMFIMGINIVFSIDSLVRKATPKLEIAYKIIRRTLILFALGIFIINHNTNFHDMRIPGVLQRFAVSYCVVTLMQWAFHKPIPDLTTMVVMASSDEGDKPWWYQVRDITVYWPQWLIIAGFEVAWHCLTFLLPVPGCPTGYIGPGGLDGAVNGTLNNCTGGAAAHIDIVVFGKRHMYAHPTAKVAYFPPDYKGPVYYDPEGLLGSFHSILIVFLGLQAGKIFLYYKEPTAKIVRCLIWSLAMGVISAILTKCSQYDGWIPVNKNLWSTTFVTTLSCFAFFILALMYFIIDVKKWWTGVPFYYVGMNSIFLYVGHEVFEGYLPFGWGAGDRSTHGELLAMNMLGTAYWVIIAYYCYKIKFFVKI